MSRILFGSMAAVSAFLAVVGGAAFADNKDTVAVPNGLAFSEFKGYQGWQVIAVSKAKIKDADVINAILGNPAMIEAFEAGFPGNGKPIPDGARMAKIHWNSKTHDDLPNHAIGPDTLHDIDFMVKDSKRFAATGGWGYAEFDYDNGTDTFKPLGTGAACGYACHTLVKTKDYVFSSYPKR
jgi:Cytochrome P460